MPGMDPWAELDLFYGEATGRAARVFARLPRRDQWAGATLVGELTGPFCRHAQTLPARHRLTDAGPGPTLLARGIVPDPSFWSPELPMLYRVTLRLVRGGETLAECERSLGIRQLGPRGKDLLLEGRRWVVRGIFTASVGRGQADLPTWRSLGALGVVPGVQPAESAAASEEGVPTACLLYDRPCTATDARTAAQHAAIIMAVLDPTDDAGATLLQEHAPNILRAAMSLGPLPKWAQLLILSVPEGDLGQFAAQAKVLPLPILAARPQKERCSIEEARAACDVLQRDLAPYGDFAGYLV